MSFVKDDHRYTRGVGAIAAMDAASPKRRIAANRAAQAMARRDAIMALGATRTTKTGVTAPARVSTSTRSTSTIETGQEAAFSRPPPPPSPIKIKLAQRPKGLLVPGVRADLGLQRPTIKLPGTVIEPPKTPLDAPKQSAGTTAAPTRAQVNIVAGGGSGVAWTSGSTKGSAEKGAPADDNPPPAWADEPAPATPAAAAKKPSSKMLLYAGLGIGALWLLTRKK